MPKFTPRQRKHKVRDRQKSYNNEDKQLGFDTNTAEIVTHTGTQTERERKKQELKASLGNAELGISSKKKKRLDKYIVCAIAPIIPHAKCQHLHRKRS